MVPVDAHAPRRGCPGGGGWTGGFPPPSTPSSDGTDNDARHRPTRTYRDLAARVKRDLRDCLITCIVSSGGCCDIAGLPDTLAPCLPVGCQRVDGTTGRGVRARNGREETPEITCKHAVIRDVATSCSYMGFLPEWRDGARRPGACETSHKRDGERRAPPRRRGGGGDAGVPRRVRRGVAATHRPFAHDSGSGDRRGANRGFSPRESGALRVPARDEWLRWSAGHLVEDHPVPSGSHADRKRVKENRARRGITRRIVGGTRS